MKKRSPDEIYPIKKPREIKIFVLYLMRNIGYPLRFSDILDITIQQNYVGNMDCQLTLFEMEKEGLIAVAYTDGEPYYEVTQKGNLVGEQLSQDIPEEFLNDSMKEALRLLNFKKRGITLSFKDDKCDDGTYNITVTMTEKKKQLLSITVNVDSLQREKMVRRNFRARPEAIYRGVQALLNGSVDFLFDS